MRSLLLTGVVAGLLLVAPALCARSEPAETDDQALRSLLFYKKHPYYEPKKSAYIDIKTKTDGDAYAGGNAYSDVNDKKIETYTDSYSKADKYGEGESKSYGSGYYEGKGLTDVYSKTYAKDGAEAYADGYAEVDKDKHSVYAGGHAYSESEKDGYAHGSTNAYATTKPGDRR